MSARRMKHMRKKERGKEDEREERERERERESKMRIILLNDLLLFIDVFSI